MPRGSRRTRSVRDAVRQAEAQVRAEAEARRRLMPVAAAPWFPERAGDLLALAAVTTTAVVPVPGTAWADPPGSSLPCRAGPELALQVGRPVAAARLLAGLVAAVRGPVDDRAAAGLAAVTWTERPTGDGRLEVNVAGVPLQSARPAPGPGPFFVTHLDPDEVAALLRAGGRPHDVLFVEAVGRQHLDRADHRTPDPAGAGLHAVLGAVRDVLDTASRAGLVRVTTGPPRTDVVGLPCRSGPGGSGPVTSSAGGAGVREGRGGRDVRWTAQVVASTWSPPTGDPPPGPTTVLPLAGSRW